MLEFTLTRLWQAQRGKTLTFAGYHAMGGVRGALDRFAEQASRPALATYSAASFWIACCWAWYVSLLGPRN